MTPEQFKDILPFYIGQEVIDSEYPEEGKFILRHETFLEYFQEEDDEAYPKLILRKLEDMTEEDINLWNNISTPIGEMHIASAQQIHWVKRINFLRSKGYDCDNLIENGYAVNRKEAER